MFPQAYVEALCDIIECKVLVKAEKEKFNDDEVRLFPSDQSFDVVFEQVWTSFDLQAYVKLCVGNIQFDQSFYTSLWGRIREAVNIRLR